MANSFVFPPPPPPPPSAATSYYSTGSSYPSQISQHPQRGRGGFSSSHSRGGRGRAEYGGARGNRSGSHSGYSYQQRNGFSQQTNHSSYGQKTHFQPHRQQHLVPVEYNGTLRADGPHTNKTKAADSYGHKRTHDQAFSRNSTVPKLQTAPAVPSFGFSLPPLEPQQTKVSTKGVSTIPARRNLLGLIPADDDHDSEDEDEEAKLAAAMGSDPTSAISFLCKGKLTTLKTAEDIATWIAERRKNFPTAARREAMLKKKQEERAKMLEIREAARKKAFEERKEKQAISDHKQAKARGSGGRSQDKQSRQGKKPGRVVKERLDPSPARSSLPLTKEQMKIEKLRRSMEKNAKKLAKLEAVCKSSSKIDLKTKGVKGFSKDPIASDSSTTDSEESSSDLSSSDDSDTSSDSDLESDDDTEGTTDSEIDEIDEESQSDSDAPQELSSTRTAPVRVPPPQRGKDNLALCRNLKKYGKCKQRGCKFRHKPKDSETRSRRPPARSENKPSGRLSLYQRLLKQQIEADEQSPLESDNLAASEQTPAVA